jgi:hypothetical protein
VVKQTILLERVMVFRHLVRHWLARRHYPFASWAACIGRSLRVLLFYRAHEELLALGVYRDHVTRIHDDVFHHLSHRHYLARDVPLRERVRCVLVHYRFEDATFDAAYRQAVYRDGGLVLWRHAANGAHVEIRLDMAQRLNAEGDLTLILLADGRRVHRLSFSWVDAHFAGAGPDAPGIVPFIARNQGRRADARDTIDAFQRAFPDNSPLVKTPGFFCLAALQGIAQALGMDRAVAVKAAWQCAYERRDGNRFANAYDGFWQVLGGVDLPGRGMRIAFPFHMKPLSEVPSKHRKRAAQRHAQWRVIGESSRLALTARLAPAPGTSALPLPLSSPSPSSRAAQPSVSA